MTILVVGGYTKDTNLIDGVVVRKGIGGPPYYAYIASRILDTDIGVVSPIGGDINLSNIHADWLFLDLYPNLKNIEFVNKYEHGYRTQLVRGGGYKLDIQLLKCAVDILSPSFIIFSPVLNEIPISAISEFSDYNLVLDIQGVVRDVTGDDEFREVRYRSVPEEIYGFSFDVLKVSSDELGYVDLNRLNARIIVVTKSREGSIIIHGGNKIIIPTIPLDNVDETGAGDIYLFSFTHFLDVGLSIYESGLYASATVLKFFGYGNDVHRIVEELEGG